MPFFMELKTFDNKPVKYKVFVAGRESYSVVSNRFVDDLIEAVLQMFSYETKKLQIFRMDRDGSKHIVYSQNAEKKAGGPVGKPVRDRYTNELYQSANQAAKATGFNRSEIYKEVTSITTSKTRFVYE
jgi:hypothetical protein